MAKGLKVKGVREREDLILSQMVVVYCTDSWKVRKHKKLFEGTIARTHGEMKYHS